VKEYTLLAASSVAGALWLDRKSGQNVLRRPEFGPFALAVIFFKLLVNGHLTKHIVRYNPRMFMGKRIGTIPVEDFLFGFSMITLALVVWEYLLGAEKASRVSGDPEDRTKP
jgi:lycopene cyclase domain-containing protein